MVMGESLDARRGVGWILLSEGDNQLRCRRFRSDERRYRRTRQTSNCQKGVERGIFRNMARLASKAFAHNPRNPATKEINAGTIKRAYLLEYQGCE